MKLIKNTFATFMIAFAVIIIALFGVGYSTSNTSSIGANASSTSDDNSSYNYPVYEGGWQTFFENLETVGPGSYDFDPVIVFVECAAIGESPYNYTDFDALCTGNACFQYFLAAAQARLLQDGISISSGSEVFDYMYLILYIQLDSMTIINSQNFVCITENSSSAWTTVPFDNNATVQASIFYSAEPYASYNGYGPRTAQQNYVEDLINELDQLGAQCSYYLP